MESLAIKIPVIVHMGNQLLLLNAFTMEEDNAFPTLVIKGIAIGTVFVRKIYALAQVGWP